jgi:putative membrane protein
MMHWDYGWGLGFGFGWVFLLFFWLLLILGIVYLIKLIGGSARRGEKEETALDILKKRICKGRDRQGRVRKNQGRLDENMNCASFSAGPAQASAS